MRPFDRRSFLRTSFITACAGAIASSSTFSAVSSRYIRTLAEALPLTSSEETVLDFVRRYSADIRLIGTGVLTKLRGAEAQESHLLVQIDDVTAFTSTMAGTLPFTVGYSDGNTFSFVLEGIEFTVENLTPEAFTQRTAEIVTLKKIAFAQDALSYDPATKQLTDPFGAEKSPLLKMVNRTPAGGAAISLAVRGRIDSKRLGMRNGGVFASWQASNLGLSSGARTAQAIAQTFLSKLSTISYGNSPDDIKSLLRSRAVSTALNRIFGIKTVDAVNSFDRFRDLVSGNYSNAAIWLVLLLRPALESDSADGAATTWVQQGTRFDMMRGKNALIEAKRLLALPVFV